MTIKRRSRAKRRGKVDTLPTRFEPKFIEDLDQRMSLTRAIKEQYEQLLEETNAQTLAKQMLAKRAIFIALQIETMEVEAASTGKLDRGTYTNLVNALSGLLTKLGLDDSSGNGTLDLQDYLANKDTSKRRKRSRR